MHNRLDWQKQLVRAAMCAITVLALAQEALPAEEGPVLSGTALWALAAGAAWALYGALLRLRRPFAPARLGVLAALLAGVVVLGQSFAAVGTAEMATSPAVVDGAGPCGICTVDFFGHAAFAGGAIGIRGKGRRAVSAARSRAGLVGGVAAGMLAAVVCLPVSRHGEQ